MFEWLKDVDLDAEARHYSNVHGGNMGTGPFGGAG